MRHLPSLLLAILLLSLLATTVRGDAARPDDRPNQPNIVLIAIDTLRADHLGSYGYERPTSPNIDRLAEQGMLFEHCYSPASWTLPVFTSMFTGYYAAVHGVTHRDRLLAASIPTITERMKEQGYYTAAVVSNPFLSAKYGFGRGFDLYDDFSVFFEAELALLAIDPDPATGRVNEMVTGEAVTDQAKILMQRAADSGRPYFVFIHYFDPHDSYIPPPPFDRKFDPNYDGPIDGRGIPVMRNNPPEGRDLEHLIARYDGEIAYQDMLLGKLMDTLDELGDPANTITILTSDHGEAWGEHGMLLHGNSPYREEVWVPMIWRWPGVWPEGHRVAQPVSMMDIAATLRDLLGLEGLEGMQAASLQALLEGGDAYEGTVLSERGLGTDHHVALTMGGRRLHARFVNDIRASDVTFEGYDLRTDPWEQRDLYNRSPRGFAEMQQMMHDIWNRSRRLHDHFDVEHEQNPVQLSDDERQRIEGLGYTDAH